MVVGIYRGWGLTVVRNLKNNFLSARGSKRVDQATGNYLRFPLSSVGAVCFPELKSLVRDCNIKFLRVNFRNLKIISSKS